MEIKRYEVNGNKYEFVCEYFETYRNWGHKVCLLKNGRELQKAKCIYINRTWENYRFQTCMLKALSQEIEEQIEELKARYKRENNINRMSKKHNEKLEEVIETDNYMQELVEVRKQVRGKVW